MFMNRVHEQCSKIDSGKIPSRTGPKTGRVHRVHSPRPAQALKPRAQRQGRTPRAPSPPPAARPALAARAPAARAHLLRPACRIVALQRAVLQYNPCLKPQLPQYFFFFFFFCDTISLQSNLPQYNFCNTLPLGCNTIQPLIIQF